jgi:hypothetical protein
MEYEEFLNLYSSPSIITVFKSIGIQLVNHIACMEKIRSCQVLFGRGAKGILGALGVNGNTLDHENVDSLGSGLAPQPHFCEHVMYTTTQKRREIS